MFKKLFLLAAIFGACLGLAAAESEAVTVPLKGILILEPGFRTADISITDRGVIAAEVIANDQIRVTGLAVGKSDLHLTAGAVSKLYTVTVVDNVREVFNSLRKDLDSVPEVEISINGNKVILKGEVSSIDGWETLLRVVPAYGAQVTNLAVFRPAPEIMLSLKKLFEKSGFKIVQDITDLSPGTLSLQNEKNTLILRGSVYCQEDMATIQQLISTQNWISLDGKDPSKPIRFINQVVIKPTLLDVGVVFVGVRSADTSAIGSNITKSGIRVAQGFNFSTIFSGGTNQSYNLGAVAHEAQVSGAVEAFAAALGHQVQNGAGIRAEVVALVGAAVEERREVEALGDLDAALGDVGTDRAGIGAAHSDENDADVKQRGFEDDLIDEADRLGGILAVERNPVLRGDQLLNRRQIFLAVDRAAQDQRVLLVLQRQRAGRQIGDVLHDLEAGFLEELLERQHDLRRGPEDRQIGDLRAVGGHDLEQRLPAVDAGDFTLEDHLVAVDADFDFRHAVEILAQRVEDFAHIVDDGHRVELGDRSGGQMQIGFSDGQTGHADLIVGDRLGGDDRAVGDVDVRRPEARLQNQDAFERHGDRFALRGDEAETRAEQRAQ